MPAGFHFCPSGSWISVVNWVWGHLASWWSPARFYGRQDHSQHFSELSILLLDTKSYVSLSKRSGSDGGTSAIMLPISTEVRSSLLPSCGVYPIGNTLVMKPTSQSHPESWSRVASLPLTRHLTWPSVCLPVPSGLLPENCGNRQNTTLHSSSVIR